MIGYHAGGYGGFGAGSSDPLTALLQQQLNMNRADSQVAGQFLATDTALANALYGHNVTGLRDQYGFDAGFLTNAAYRDVDLARQQAANEFNAGQRNVGLEFGNLARLAGLADSQLGNQYQTLEDLLGRTGIERTNAIEALNRNFNLAGDRYELGLGENRTAYNASDRRAVSDQTVRGSSLSAGARRSRDELVQQLNLANKGEELTYKGAEDDFDTGLSAADLRYRTGVDTYNAGMRNAELDFESSTGDLRHRGDQLRNQRDDAKANFDLRSKMIDSIADDYGIRADELKSTLNRGIDRLGIDLQSTLNQLAKDFQSSDVQRRANANAIMQQLIMAGQTGGGQQAPRVPSSGMTPAQIERARWEQIAEQRKRDFLTRAQNAQPGPSPAYGDTGMSPSYPEGPGFGVNPVEQALIDARNHSQ